jgi:hypothetical protein
MGANRELLVGVAHGGVNEYVWLLFTSLFIETSSSSKLHKKCGSTYLFVTGACASKYKERR